MSGVDRYRVGVDRVVNATSLKGILTKWFFLKVNAHSSSNGISNTQERRGKVVGSSMGVDATFKVPVSGQHTTHH